MYLDLAKRMLDDNYVYGVRSLCDDETYEVGDDCRESYDWDLDADCSTYHTSGLTAGGTCATNIDTQYFASDDWAAELSERIARAVEENSAYGGGKQVIIAGKMVNNDRMLDPGEVRIRNAFVYEVLQ